MKNQSEVEQEIAAARGEKQTALLKQHACSRICGFVLRRGPEWDEAYSHISEHFRRIPGKPSHTLFRRRYRNEEAIADLLSRAANHPSTVRLTKLKIAGERIGQPGVEVVRQFSEPVGDSDELVYLRILMDSSFRVRTAYPDDKLLGD